MNLFHALRPLTDQLKQDWSLGTHHNSFLLRTYIGR